MNELIAEGLRDCIRELVISIVAAYPMNLFGTVAHANFLYDCAIFFNSQGMHQVEYSKYEEARNVDIQLGDLRGALMSKNGMAVALGEMGKVQEALRLQRELRTEYMTEFGPEEKETLIVKYNLGVWLQRAEEWEEAESVLRDVLESRKSIEKPMSDDIRNIMQHLAEVLRDSEKDLVGATRIFDKLIAHETKVSGRNQASTLLIVAARGRALALLGSHQEATEAYTEALPAIHAAWGANDEYVKSCQEWLAFSVAALGGS